ncbi:MAG: AgmX/PglI C-terminal domain-containing protein [Polyangiales bacterium]
MGRSPRTFSLAVLVFALVAACNKRSTDRENISRPVDTVASASAKASNEPTLAIAVTESACHSGQYVPPPAATDAGAADEAGSLLGDPDGGSFGFGGLGLSGTGGYGGSIGLGTIGGYGTGGLGGSVFRTVRLEGQTLRVKGLLLEGAERVVCDAFLSFATCVDAAATAENDLDGTIGLAWTIDDDGNGTAKVVGGTLEDEKLRACLIEAASKAKFPAPESKSATVTYALHAHRPRKTKQVKMTEVGSAVTGRLPPEVIRRIARANFPRFRYCYEQELKKDPALKGTITTKLVIDTTGAVESAATGGSTMANATVEACILKVFKSMSFPEPEGGKVTVSYPIKFENEY